MFVGRDGCGIVMEHPGHVTVDIVDRSRDIAIVRMRARGFSYRQIGRFLGMTHVGVMKRFRAIPAWAKERYAEAEMVA